MNIDWLKMADSLMTSGLLFVLAGTAALCSFLFKKEYASFFLLQNKIPCWKKIFFLSFTNINSENINPMNWWKFYSPGNEQKIKDPNGILRGLIFIFMGTLLQIAGVFITY